MGLFVWRGCGGRWEEFIVCELGYFLILWILDDFLIIILLDKYECKGKEVYLLKV